MVDKFSDIRKFDELVEITSNFEEKANKAYLQEMRSDKRVAQRARELESDISRVGTEISITRKDIKEKRDSIDTYNKTLSQLEDNQEASQRYRDIKERLKTQEDKRNKLMAQIGAVNYNHALLDRMWILAPFSPTLKIFQEKYRL